MPVGLRFDYWLLHCFVLVGDRSVAEAFDEWINQGSLNCMIRSRDHMNCMILT